MADPPKDVANLVAELGHAPLQSFDSFAVAFTCPTCGSRANFTVTGWSGWAVEERCDRVLRATGSSA